MRSQKEPTRTLTERVIHGSSIIFFFTILTSPLGFFIRVLYSHSLSIEMYGLFYAVLSFFGFFSLFSDLGFGYSVIYFIPKYLKKKDYATCWNLFRYNQIVVFLTSIIVILTLFVSSDWLSKNYFKVNQAGTLIRILCIYYLAGCFVNTLEKFFIGLQQEIYYSSIEFIRLAFTLLFSLLFWTLKLSTVYYFAYSWAIAYVLTAMIYSFIAYQNNKLVDKPFYFDKKLLKKMYDFAVPTLLTSGTILLTGSMDIFFLTLFKGVKEVGIYNIVLPLVAISSIFLSPFKVFFLPLISHFMEDDKKKVSEIVEMILKFIPFISFYFVLFTITFPAISIELLFGKKWVAYVELPLIILSFGYIFVNLTTYFVNIIAGMGFVKERLKISIIIAILNIVLSLFLIKIAGVIGAVVANSLIYIISVILYLKFIKSTISLHLPFRFYFKLFIFGLAFYGLTHFLKIAPTNWPEFIVYGILYTGIMALFSLYLKLINKKMIKLVFKRKL